MIQLGKRSRRPVIGALVALTTTAVILAAPGSAGAVSKASAARPAAASAAARVGSSPAAVAASIPTGGQAFTQSRIDGTTANGRHVAGTFKPGLAKTNPSGGLSVRGTLKMVVANFNGTKSTRTVKNQWIKVIDLTTPSGSSKARQSSAAAAAAAAACPILHLVLGPLDLNLLGLKVHLNTVVLNIVAQPGPGNLLGNLLCAVAHLLDGPALSGLLAQVATLLNSILAILRA